MEVCFVVSSEDSAKPPVITLGMGARPQDVEIESVHVFRYPAGYEMSRLNFQKMSYPGREADSPWRVAAAERIEKNNAEAPVSPQQPLIAEDVQVIKDAVATAPATDLRPVTAAIDNLSKELAGIRKENTELKRELQEAKDSIWARVQFWISISLYGGAVAALVLAVLRAKAAVSTGLDILGGVKSAAFLLSLSATLFSVARFVAAWWFPWACGGIVALTLGYLGYLVWQQQRAEQFKRALRPVVATLDARYEEASEEARKDLDEHVFSRIGDAMRSVPGAKKAIHSLRAEGLSP
jgi:hypothetical protein